MYVSSISGCGCVERRCGLGVCGAKESLNKIIKKKAMVIERASASFEARLLFSSRALGPGAPDLAVTAVSFLR